MLFHDSLLRATMTQDRLEHLEHATMGRRAVPTKERTRRRWRRRP